MIFLYVFSLFTGKNPPHFDQKWQICDITYWDYYTWAFLFPVRHCVPLSVSITVDFHKIFAKIDVRNFQKFRYLLLSTFLIDRGSLLEFWKSNENFCKNVPNHCPKHEVIFVIFGHFQKFWSKLIIFAKLLANTYILKMHSKPS